MIDSLKLDVTKYVIHAELEYGALLTFVDDKNKFVSLRKEDIKPVQGKRKSNIAIKISNSDNSNKLENQAVSKTTSTARKIRRSRMVRKSASKIARFFVETNKPT